MKKVYQQTNDVFAIERFNDNKLFAGIMVLFLSNHINSNINVIIVKLSKMNLPWFKRNGIFFIPISIIGWLLLLCGLAFAVYIFIHIDSRSHSASDTLRNFVFNLLIIGVVYSLIAYMTSREPKR